MVESAYAFSKFIDAKNKIYSEDEQKDTGFLFNLETLSAFNFLPDMTRTAAAQGGVNGIVFGRVDFSMSKGLSRDAINTQTPAASNAKPRNVTGGAWQVGAAGLLQ
jgi:hypothetical protein